MSDRSQGNVIQLEEIYDLKPIQCPQRGGINFPCVICKQCEIGDVTLTFGDGYLVENTVNSILIHIPLEMSEDVVEKAALDYLKAKLSEKVPPIQRGDWDEGDVAIMITNDMAKDLELVKNVENFLKEFPNQWRSLAVQAKRQLKTWADNNAKQLAHKYFREI